MAIGFVLVNVAPQHEQEVYEALRRLPEVVELHPLFGEFDLIAKIESPDFDALGRTIVNKVRTVAGVVDTKTLTGTKF